VRINLGALLESAQMIARVLRLGGRHEAARTMESLVAACEQLAEQLAIEQSKSASLMTALTEEIAKGGVR
jgi:hypothetical protein